MIDDLPPPRALAVAGVAGLAVAASVFAVLYLLARAPDQEERTADLKARRMALAALPRPEATPKAYPRGAVCESGLAPAAMLLRARIDDAATAAGVTVSGLEVNPAPAATGEALSVIRLNLVANGPYVSGLNFSKILADGTPTVFIEQLDVVPGPDGAAEWRMAARVYCAIRLTP
jgi:hypothetical protein